jgi:heptosyltransferase II
MHLLIIKKGALGDVVRTSYFAGALKRKFGSALRLSWITAPASADLLRRNPYIDDLWVDFEAATLCRFDRIFSLDDELETISNLASLAAAPITGAYLENGRPAYSADASEWFDMGLHSRFGKARADELKRLNRVSHAQIFSRIFGVDQVRPEFYLDPDCAHWAEGQLPRAAIRVGINPYSGGRWPSKELRPDQLDHLLDQLLQGSTPFGRCSVVLLGADADYVKNAALVARRGTSGLSTICTDESVQHLAGVVGALDYLISSDSLALHLAIAQDVPFTAFFSPTSAPEIDDWGIGTKVVSTAADYCSYRKDADNSTITAARIIDAIRENPKALEPRRSPPVYRQQSIRDSRHGIAGLD